MAKHPVPGRVKTRLAAALGAEVACALYRAFILDLADRLAALPWAVSWAYWPPDAPFGELVPGARCRPQRGADLGERLARAIEAEFAAAPGPVIAIGADAPHLPVARLAEAAAALAGEAEVVLGPTADGGYDLIGLAAPAPALFAGVPWSTPGVLAATLARARGLGLRVRRLAPSFDVDEPADLERLRALLGAGEVRLPRTAAVLAGLLPPRS